MKKLQICGVHNNSIRITRPGENGKFRPWKKLVKKMNTREDWGKSAEYHLEQLLAIAPKGKSRKLRYSIPNHLTSMQNKRLNAKRREHVQSKTWLSLNLSGHVKRTDKISNKHVEGLPECCRKEMRCKGSGCSKRRQRRWRRKRIIKKKNNGKLIPPVSKKKMKMLTDSDNCEFSNFELRGAHSLPQTWKKKRRTWRMEENGNRWLSELGEQEKFSSVSGV